MSKNFKILEVKNLPDSTAEIVAEIDTVTFEFFYEEALRKVVEEIELPGFRKGRVPKDLYLQKFGEVKILERAASLSIEKELPAILLESKTRILGNPKISITKLAKGNPIGIKIEVSLLPSFNLPDYATIAAGVPKPGEPEPIAEKEIDDVLMEIRKEQQHQKFHKENPGSGHDHPPIVESDLPPLTNELAKEFGNFKDVPDLREKVKENLKKEKEIRAKEKRRADITERILSATLVTAPKVLVESELNKMIAEFVGELSRANITLENYLKHIGKTEDDLRKEMFPNAEKKARMEIIFHEIAQKEKIAGDTETARKDTEKILTLYPDADPVRVRSYIESVLTNQKVLEFLENLGH